MELPSQLSQAASAFEKNRRVNLLAAAESLALLVDLTNELSTQLGAIGGPRAVEVLSSRSPRAVAPARQTPPQTEPNLYAVVEDSVQAICIAYDAFAAARELGRFKQELKHFTQLLPIVSTLSAALSDMSSEDDDTELGLQQSTHENHTNSQGVSPLEPSKVPPPSPYPSLLQRPELEQERAKLSSQHDDQQQKVPCPVESEESDAFSDSSYTGSNDSSECATITLERDLDRPPARAAASEAKTKMVDRAHTGPDFEDEDEEEHEVEGKLCNDGSSDLTADAVAEARSANSKTFPLAVKDSNATDGSSLNIVSASDAKKLKKLYKPAFEGKAPDPEDAGFAPFHDKQGRDCR